MHIPRNLIAISISAALFVSLAVPAGAAFPSFWTAQSGEVPPDACNSYSVRGDGGEASIVGDYLHMTSGVDEGLVYRQQGPIGEDPNETIEFSVTLQVGAGAAFVALSDGPHWFGVRIQPGQIDWSEIVHPVIEDDQPHTLTLIFDRQSHLSDIYFDGTLLQTGVEPFFHPQSIYEWHGVEWGTTYPGSASVRWFEVSHNFCVETCETPVSVVDQDSWSSFKAIYGNRD